MNELEEKKLAAEIALLDAQATKTREDAKLALKAQKSKTSIVEVIKLFGSLILGIGGITAVITGYQLTEVKKERMELEIQKREKDLEETSAALKTAQQELNQTSTQIAALRTELGTLKAGLASTTNPSTESAVKRVDAAIDNAKSVENSVQKAQLHVTNEVLKIERKTMTIPRIR
jgi:DNA repair exonuclease SbcCD ATPase subunit